MLKTICAAALLLVALTASASAEMLTLAAHYSVAGKNPNGSRYGGTADVQIISDTTFAIVWHIRGAGSSSGFGMRMNNTISATYMLNGQPGLAIYKSQSDGSFSGIWAVRGHDGNGAEVLTPLD